MNEWRQDLRSELLMNRSHYLTSRQAKLSGNITEDFPDQKVLRLYTHPAAHDTDLVGLSFSCADLQAGQLTALAAVTFQWGRSAKDLFKRYMVLFFPAMAVRQLVQGAVDIDGGVSDATGEDCCPMLGAIVGERESHSTCFLHEFRVMLLIPYQLILDICMALPGPPLSKSTIVEIEGDCKKCCAWLPCDMVEVVRPDLVSTYKGTSTRSSMCCCLCRSVFLSVHICAAYQHHGHL
jgi:hypothetical protein